MKAVVCGLLPPFNCYVTTQGRPSNSPIAQELCRGYICRVNVEVESERASWPSGQAPTDASTGKQRPGILTMAETPSTARTLHPTAKFIATKMSQHIQHHHPQAPPYVHYGGPSNATYIQTMPMMQGGQGQPMHHVVHYPPHPQQLQSPPAPAPAASTSGSASNPPVVVAQGDWTKDLVQLAKQAELKCVTVLLSSPNF